MALSAPARGWRGFMVPSSPIGVDDGERVEILIVVVPDLALLRRTCYEPVDSTHPDTQGSPIRGKSQLPSCWHPERIVSANLAPRISVKRTEHECSEECAVVSTVADHSIQCS